ncbi:MAG: hypothetical protein RLN75_06130 [Longimicrobiales bacterium]
MPTPTLRRLPLALAVLGAGWVVAAALLADTRAWAGGRTLVPLVFVLTILMEWAADLDTEEGVLHAVFGKLQELWESAGAGFYGAVAAATFVRAEAVTLVDEWNEAGSFEAFVRSELVETLLGFSLASIMNMVEAAIWFVGWLSLPLPQMAGLLAATFAAYALGRWAWPDPDRDDALETALERLTRRD